MIRDGVEVLVSCDFCFEFDDVVCFTVAVSSRRTVSSSVVRSN